MLREGTIPIHEEGELLKYCCVVSQHVEQREKDRKTILICNASEIYKRKKKEKITEDTTTISILRDWDEKRKKHPNFTPLPFPPLPPKKEKQVTVSRRTTDGGSLRNRAEEWTKMTINSKLGQNQTKKKKRKEMVFIKNVESIHHSFFPLSAFRQMFFSFSPALRDKRRAISGGGCQFSRSQTFRRQIL